MSSASTAANQIWLPAYCAAVLFAAGLMFSPAHAHPSTGMFERLGRMELLVVGQISPQLPLPQRIGALETQLFGRVQTGALPERLTRIQEFVESSRQGEHPITQSAVAKPSPQAQGADPAVTGLLRQALDEHNKGRDSESEKLYRQVLAKEPFNAHASFNLGAISERRGDLTAALGHYHTALLADPNDRQLQEAVASVEDQIAHSQKPVFTNPLRATASGSTLLQGRASQLTACGDTDYTTGGAPGQALVPQAAPDFRLFQQAPISAPLIPPRRRLPQATTALAPPAVLPITQQTPPSANKAVFKSAAKAAVITAIRFAPGSMGGLHCPLCRLLGGF